MLDWMTKYESIWLFLFAVISLGLEAYTAFILKMEYDYDAQKDIEKKQKRTKTTKKTTTQPGGASITEESTEVVEPTGDHKP